ncbi:hypothetical protein AB0M47_06465 [Hamadaea sp. NPDC051192]|uniref:hypothetical protein n=1 Tax=Hamadaea sp. NPDC051192 TaxID=3154940 RepID=UPI00342D9CBE
MSAGLPFRLVAAALFGLFLAYAFPAAASPARSAGSLSASSAGTAASASSLSARAGSAGSVGSTALAGSAGSAAEAQVDPNPVRPGAQVDVVATCPAAATSASISATTLDGASNMPMLASAKNPREWSVTLTIPAETQPGTYALGGTCGDGTGFTASVVVATVLGPMGGGGSTMGGPSDTLLVVGILLLAASVAVWRLARR